MGHYSRLNIGLAIFLSHNSPSLKIMIQAGQYNQTTYNQSISSERSLG